MVFTVRVRRADHGLSRRGLLAAAAGGLAAAGLGACDIGARATVLWHPAPDALLPFLTSTIALADTYDAAIATLPSLATLLTPLRDAHRQHVTALRRELGLVGATDPPTAPTRQPAEDPTPSTGTGGSASVPPSPAPSGASGAPSGSPATAGTPENTGLPADRAGLVAALRAAEQKAQADATAACLTAPTYRAALLGSIAACRSTHLAVLV